MRFYITLSLLITSLASSAIARKDGIDSLRRIVTLSLQGNAKPDTSTVNRLNKLADDYYETNQDSTLLYGQRAIELARKINYKAGIAGGLVQTGHAWYFKKDFEQAKKNYDHAILIYKLIKDTRGLSICYGLYGRMFNKLGNYIDALKYIKLAAILNRQLKDTLNEAENYKNIGIVYTNKSQYSTALDYYYKALLIGVKQHNKSLSAALYNDIGLVLYSMEAYQKALEYYKKGIYLFEETHDLLGTGIASQNIGETWIKLQSYDQAIPYLVRTKVIAQQQDDKDETSSVQTDLALCYANKKDFSKAINYLNSSLSIAVKYKMTDNEAYALISFAAVYNLQNQYKKAWSCAIQGQKLAVKLGNLTVRSDAAMQLNKALAGLGKFNDAYEVLKYYIDLKDSLNYNGAMQKLTSYNLEFDFAAKKREMEEKQLERELLYKQRTSQQRLVNGIFLCVILSLIAISIVYHRQKRKQEHINYLLKDRNKQVLEQKTNLNEQAQKLNDLNTLKDRLISVLAHDLRAPLSTLRGLFSLLEDDTISHQQLLDMIPNVLKKLEYTSDFLDTLLFWVNSQMDNFESSAKKFNVKDIVSFETENYHEQASLKGISLINNVPADIIASADPNSIRIVIRNLITNAIKFSDQGDKIEISAYREGNHYVIRVADTGTGIAADQLEKLFKSKVNSKSGTNNESGTGMGMMFCKDLVEKCSGKIWVNSEQGHGTEFSFTLPAGITIEPDLELV